MKSTFIGLLLLSSISFLRSQQIIKGHISNEQKLPLKEVLVQVLESGQSTKSKEDGSFLLEGKFPSQVHLLLTYSGYESQTVSYSFSSNEKLELAMTAAHVDFEEVSVVAGMFFHKNKNPYHLETRKLSDLNVIAGVNLMDLITRIPGVYSSTLGNGISKPVVRGLQGMRVLTAINGVRLEGQQWGGDHGIGLAELGIGSVEVIKGPASLLYGADAIGGVVLFNDEVYAPNHSQNLNMSSSFHTNSLGTVNRLVYKRSTEKFRWLTAASFVDHADFLVPNGKYVKNSRFMEGVVKSALGWNGNNSVHHLRMSVNRVRTGIPGHTHDTIIDVSTFLGNSPDRSYTIPAQFQTNYILSFDNKWFKDRNEWQLQLSQTMNHLKEFDEKVTIPGIDLRLWNTLYTLRWQQRNVSKPLKLSAGFQGMSQFNLNGPDASEILTPDAWVNDNGAYFNAFYSINKWNFQAGVRYDVRYLQSFDSINGFGTLSNFYQSPNGAFGAVFSDKKVVFRANLSSGFRAPHFTELLSNGFHHGALRYEIGDPQLKSERATQVELTGEWNGEHLILIANPFVNHISNFIYIDPVNQTVQGLPVFYYRQKERVLMYGGDLAAHWHPHFAHNLHVESSISLIYANAFSDSSISLIPQPRWQNTLRYQFDWGKKWQLKEVNLQATYMGAQNTVAYYESPSNAYFLMNASITFQQVKTNFWAIQLGVRNLLNEQFIDHLSRLKNIQIPNQGRNIYVSVSYNLSNQLKSK